MIRKAQQYSGQCLKCDSNCLTCVNSPTNCLTCKSGYSLSVAKICMNNDQIKYTMRLDMPFEQYSAKVYFIKLALGKIFQN